MKVAIVVDWLVVLAGAEKVMAEIMALYPQAHIFTIIDQLNDRSFLQGRIVKTSILQILPKVGNYYRSLLPLRPAAIALWDFSPYDLVISLSHAVVNGIKTGPKQVHISYIHTPMRYAWDLQEQYLELTHRGKIATWGLRLMLNALRRWDRHTAQRPHALIANSAFIARRIQRCWNRSAEVIHPPIQLDRFKPSHMHQNFYLSVGRLVPYKRMDMLVEAFNATPQRQLILIGDGPQLDQLRSNAGPNISLLGFQPDHVVDSYLQRCKAFIMPAIEDFGIAALEAQASGKPVIALAQGAATETLRGLDHSNPSALFFAEQNAASLIKALDQFEQNEGVIAAQSCRDNAQRFSAPRFRQDFSQIVQRLMTEKTAK